MIGHCKIESRDSGFGFAEPYYIHETLKALVLHYQETSLAEHNDELDLTLKCPVNAPKNPPPSRYHKNSHNVRDNYEIHNIPQSSNNTDSQTYVQCYK